MDDMKLDAVIDSTDDSRRIVRMIAISVVLCVLAIVGGQVGCNYIDAQKCIAAINNHDQVAVTLQCRRW